MITEQEVSSLKRYDARVKELEKRVRLFTLDFDLERICVYLQQELEASIEPREQRIFVAEVALIEKQFLSLVSGLQLANDITLSDNKEEGTLVCYDLFL